MQLAKLGAALSATSLLVLGSAHAYNIPAGADAAGNDRFTASLTEGDLNATPERLRNGRLHTHGRITMAALAVLSGDGKTAAASEARGNLQALMNGLMQADTGQGTVTFNVVGIPAATFEPASMSHFYDVTRGGSGLTLDLGGAGNTVAELIKLFSTASWQTSTLMGPHPASSDMCEYHYARAVDWMRKGNPAEAYRSLGFAIHYIQDATVPQHVTNQSGATPGSNHVEYETRCDELTRPGNGFVHATNGGVYRNDWAPAQFVDHAARNSAPRLGQTRTPGQWDPPARDLIPLAERLSAGLIARFHESWRTENFTVALLTVDRATALSGYRDFIGADVRDPSRDVDTVGQADFYGIFDFAGRRSVTAPIVGGDNIVPNEVVPNCWFFPRRVAYGTTRIPLHFELWDYDDGLNGGDDLIDIHAGDGKRVLDLTYDLAANSVGGDLTGSAGNDAPVLLSTTGSGRSRTDGDWPKASVQLRLQRWPTVGASARYRSLSGSVTVAGKPFSAGYIFYRPIGNGASTWQRAVLDNQGTFLLSGLAMGVAYDIRPAASGIDFRSVPVRVTVTPDTAPLRFAGTRPPRLSELVTKVNVSVLAAAIPRSGKLSGGLSASAITAITKVGAVSAKDKVLASAELLPTGIFLKDVRDQLNALLLGAAQVQSGGGEMGVLRNRLGYSDRTTVRLRLRRWLDKDGNPVASIADLAPKKIPLIKILPDGRKLNLGERWIFNGRAEGGVEGAQIRVRALSSSGGLLSETTGTTDAGGDVSFTLRAGTHFDEVLFVFEIVSNPINAWLVGTVPSNRDETTIFSPAASGDDFIPSSAYSFGNEFLRLRLDAQMENARLLSSLVLPRSGN